MKVKTLKEIILSPGVVHCEPNYFTFENRSDQLLKFTVERFQLTDEELAQEYANSKITCTFNCHCTLVDAYLAGLKKGREK